MRPSRFASSARDPVAIAALVVAGVLVATLLVGLLVPIYTDEIAWRMMLSRSPLDGGFDRTLGDQCGANATLAAPLFMQPMRHASAWVALHVPDPRAVRIAGVAGALLWVALFWRLARALPDELRSAGRTIGLSLAGLGVLPFLLVWSRPEQPLLLAYTLGLLIALAPHRSGPVRSWAGPLAIAALGLITLAYHPKAVVFLPILLVAIAVSGRGREGRGARIAALALLIGCAMIAYSYWSKHLACPGDPEVAAMMARENVTSALGDRPPLASLALLMKSALPWRYVSVAAPAPDYMSEWLPAVPVPAALGVAWQFMVRALWRVVIIITVLLLAAGTIRAVIRRTVDPRLAAAVTVAAAVAAWSATQLIKNSYESALQLPLIAIAIVLAMSVLPPRFRPAMIGCARPLAAVAVLSQILLVALYGPTLMANAARPGPIEKQPYSYVPWNYPSLKGEIAEAARACAIDPLRSRHLLVDDMTYFAMMRSSQPLHRMAIFGPWHGAIGDPVTYLQAQGSSGVITACAYLPVEVRAQAKANGRFCCLGPWAGAAH